MSYVKCHSRYAHKMWWGPEKGLNPAGHTGWYQGGSVLLLKNFLPMLCPNHPMSLRVEERFKQVLVKFPSGCLWWAFNAYGGGGINCRLSPMCSANGAWAPMCIWGWGWPYGSPGLHRSTLVLRQTKVLRLPRKCSATSSGFSWTWLPVIPETLPHDTRPSSCCGMNKDVHWPTS